jgi:hypothetical protein
MLLRWSDQGGIHAACMEEMKNAYKKLVEKYEGKTPLVRSRYRWNYIKMDLKQIGVWIMVDWTNLAQECVKSWGIFEHDN